MVFFGHCACVPYGQAFTSGNALKEDTMAEQKAKHAANAAKKAEKSADTKETSLKEDILQESIADLN
ncbi:nucleotide exchange factor GrpE, partial [Lacticaseibacillus paracasei]